MTAYGALARFYDELTRDVAYGDFADYYEGIFKAEAGEYKTILDLCCGTGSLACMLAERGYDMIAADSSPDMLISAREKADRLLKGVPPLLICQGAAQLDLFGTVDAAISSLDSISYIPPEDIREAFRRLSLFIRPGGLFIFDIRTPGFLRGMDGTVSVDETEDLLCLWRGDFDSSINALVYGIDIFFRCGGGWQREFEEHIEYAHDPDYLCALLRQFGFSDVKVNADGPGGGDDRVFIIAKRET